MDEQELLSQFEAAEQAKDWAKYWQIKDKLFALRQATGRWPYKTCIECSDQACCKRDWHHSGDCCLHCGNDERQTLRRYNKVRRTIY